MIRLCYALIASLTLAAACQSSGEAPQGAAPEIAYLTPTQHLIRASVALRGVLPSVEEMDAVDDDPAALEALIDAYLNDPRFGLTMRELHAEALLIDVDSAIYPAGFPAIPPLETLDVETVNRAVREAPLRLIEDVIARDRPYSEIVTADYAIADPITAAVFAMSYDDADPQVPGPAGQGTIGPWRRSAFSDGRPLAGILSDPFLFVRHSSTFSNKNRGRANAIARGLLCYDFLDRSVEIDTNIDLADPEAVANAIRTDPQCVSCHQTLDPLAAYFSAHEPVLVAGDIDAYPVTTWRPSLRITYAASEPGFFGIPRDTGDLRELGARIGDDPRFARCATERFYGFLAAEPAEDAGETLIRELQSAFVESDYSAKVLARTVVLSDRFRESHLWEAPDADDADTEDGPAGLKRVRPAQMARLIEDLTGYRWRTRLDVDLGGGQLGVTDLMTDSLLGFEVLGGGTDSVFVVEPVRTSTPTAVLVQRGLAGRAAAYVVAEDFAVPAAERRLLWLVEPDTSGEAEIRAQLAALERRLFGVDVDGEDIAIDESARVFAGVLGATGDPVRAWTVTLYALLQDPRLTHF